MLSEESASSEAASREPMLFEPVSHGREWVVLHARPRCEKKLVAACEELDVECYLPLTRKVHHYGCRSREFMNPLFPGYLFSVTTPDQRIFVRQNRYVANLLEVPDQEKLLRQLRQIDQALRADDALEVMPYLAEGKMVRVSGGPLKGLQGVVQRVKGKTRVVISVDMIQQSVAMEVEATYLVPE